MAPVFEKVFLVPGNPWLHRYAVFVAASTLILIFVGGLVTTTGSGLAVPDWPLSFGQVFPEMKGGVAFEHGHRLVATSVGILTIILTLWVWKGETRKWVRRLGALALAAIVCQGILGGITVLLKLPPAVSISHAALAQIFFCITICLAISTSNGWLHETAHLDDPGHISLKALATLTTIAIYLQILLGAWMRHTGSGLAIPDFPLAYGHLIPPIFTRQIEIHFAHRIGAAGVTVLVSWLALRVLRRFPDQQRLTHSALLLLSVLLLQIGLGALTIWTSRALIPTTLHVAIGALTLASSLSFTLRAHRVLLPRQAARIVSAALSRPASE